MTMEDAILDFLATFSLDIPTLIYLFTVILVAVVAVRVVALTMNILAARFKSQGNKLRMLIPMFKLLVYAGVIFLILTSVFDLGSAEILVFSGLFGAAVGLGLKDVFADMVTGIIIVFEKPYHIGDRVRVEGHYGEVKDMGFRATRILTPDDDLVSVPNLLMFNTPVASTNYGSPHMMVTIDIYTDFDCDRQAVLGVLHEAVVTSRFSTIGNGYPVITLVKDFPYYVRFRVRSYVWEMADEFVYETDITVRAWNELRRMGVRPPRLALPEGIGG